MPSINSAIFDDLEFKIPVICDIEPKLKFNALTPRQYLDLVECSIKLLPDINAARKRSMLNKPTVRFIL
jgi:hypothetical protein